MENPETFCNSVDYYSREKGLPGALTPLPYIVASRKSEVLLQNLLKDNNHILFDGLHTTHLLGNPLLAGRRKFVRMHNIEHKYYESLSFEERNSFKSMFYSMDASKLQRYEKILKKADSILCISGSDLEYFKTKYTNALLCEPSHPFEKVESQTGTGSYLLFHADLSVTENDGAALFLCEEIAPKVKMEFIFAGKQPSDELISLATKTGNVRIIPDPSEVEMAGLIRDAHINIAIGKSSNGFRLRLLYSLFGGRHCIANHKILAGSNLERYFSICDTPEAIVETVGKLTGKSFTEEMINEREILLNDRFSNRKNALALADKLFKQDLT